VTREGIRPIAAFVAAVLAAAVLAACGGSGSSSSTASSNTTAAQEGSKDSAGESQGSKSSGKPGDVATPLKVSGGGSEQFRSKGGDNSIQEFGEESDESELQEAAEAVHGFFVTRAEGDWSEACAYLSKAMTEQLKQLAASSTELEDKSCAPFLEAFTSHLSDSTWREVTTMDAGSLRHEGKQGFLIYYGAGKTVYAMPLGLEDGKWKVGALSGDPLN
jgi:hypothetical protein